MTKRVAIINDSHLGVRGDSSVFLDFQERFFNEVFFPKIESLNIDTVLNLGDSFDRRKYVNFGTLKRGKEFLFDKLQQKNIYSPTILGNHDIFTKNHNKINSVSLLLKEYNNIDVIEEPKTIMLYDQYPICMIPWISQDNEARCIDVIKNTKADLCMGHFPINGFVMHVGQVCEDGIARDLFDKFDMVLSGHFHHRSTDGRIYYLGAQYEMTWNDYGDQKGFHILDLDTRELEFVPNPYSMFHRIVYNDTQPLPKDLSVYKNVYVKVVVEKRKNEKRFEKFMDDLYKANPFDLKIVENYIDVNEIPDGVNFDQSENTLTLLNTYVEHLTIGGNVDKEKLKMLFCNIYNEAINMEAM